MEERINALEKQVEDITRRIGAIEGQRGITASATARSTTEVEPASATGSSAGENWERSIAFSLQWEGGRNFDIVNGKPVVKGAAKADAGGATAYGIIVSTLQAAHKAGVVSHEDICKLTQAEAKLIYKKNFWDRYGWGELAWPACLCCLDISINHGPKGWGLILQRAITDCGQSVTIDGAFGPKTFAAAKACDPVALARAIAQRRKEYYEKIIANNPSQAVFRKGWMRRVDGMMKAAGVS